MEEHIKGQQQSIESMAALLQSAFGFNKTILLSESEGTPDDHLPTYANIMRELAMFIPSNPNSDYFFIKDILREEWHKNTYTKRMPWMNANIVPCDAIDTTTNMVGQERVITDQTLRKYLIEDLPRGSELVVCISACHDSQTLLDFKHYNRYKVEDDIIHRVGGLLQKQKSLSTQHGLIPGLRALPPEDIDLHKEIYKGRSYRLHSAQSAGKAVIVKVYEGRYAKEFSAEAAAFSRKVMCGETLHSSFLQMFAATPGNMGPAFIAFRGEYQGTVESIASVLLFTSLEQSFVLGLQTVIALSSGLDYLCNVDYPVLGSDIFVLLLSNQGTVKISFDPDISQKERHAPLSNADRENSMMLLFHRLIQKTFHGPCKDYWERKLGISNDETQICSHHTALAIQDKHHSQPSLLDSDVPSSSATHSALVNPRKSSYQDSTSEARNEEGSPLEEIYHKSQAFLRDFLLDPLLDRQHGHSSPVGTAPPHGSGCKAHAATLSHARRACIDLKPEGVDCLGDIESIDDQSMAITLPSNGSHCLCKNSRNRISGAQTLRTIIQCLHCLAVNNPHHAGRHPTYANTPDTDQALENNLEIGVGKGSTMIQAVAELLKANPTPTYREMLKVAIHVEEEHTRDPQRNTQLLTSLLKCAFGVNETILLSDSEGTHEDYIPSYANIIKDILLRELLKEAQKKRMKQRNASTRSNFAHQFEYELRPVYLDIIPCDAIDTTNNMIDQEKVITRKTLRRYLIENLPSSSELVDIVIDNFIKDLNHDNRSTIQNEARSVKKILQTGGQFYSAGGSLTINQIPHEEQKSQSTQHGLIPGLRALPPEDLDLHHEIYKGRGYRLHSAQSVTGKVIVVKVYEGRYAKELSTETAAFSRKVMHSSFCQLFAATPGNTGPAFIAFCGEYQGTVESIASVLLFTSLEQSFVLGLQTVIALSSGLDYLRNVDYPVLDSDNFVLLLSNQGTVKISFDPDIPRRERQHAPLSNADRENSMTLLFHRLIQKTFHGPCKDYWERKLGLSNDETQICLHHNTLAIQDKYDSQPSLLDSEDPSSSSTHSALVNPRKSSYQDSTSEARNEEGSPLEEICHKSKAFLRDFLLDPLLDRQHGHSAPVGTASSHGSGCKAHAATLSHARRACIDLKPEGVDCLGDIESSEYHVDLMMQFYLF
ncbi:hypothetical protein CVT25_010490 [Psilocybe cyanescens]|uniref:Protein kinase domain-containing protein n=1 Tax=Psilocybe cyanescens TaxID=93625 RepID=A0A409XDK0_PSICY|nr:hypothetical protein CVT25_010490 [Psilocybe cyanescens]